MSNEMNNKHKEQLSAFIDNEIGPDELSELASDSALLHRYQLIGDAVKGNLCDASLIDVSAQVKLAIESEPVHSAAQKSVSQKSSSAQSWFDFSAWLRPVGGMAVAASVAIVMVMVTNQPETAETGIATGSQVAIDIRTDTRPVTSLPVNNVDPRLSDMIKTNAADDELEDDLKKNTAVNGFPQDNTNQ